MPDNRNSIRVIARSVLCDEAIPTLEIASQKALAMTVSFWVEFHIAGWRYA